MAQQPEALQGLAAYLRAEAGSIERQSLADITSSATTLREWATQVERLQAAQVVAPHQLTELVEAYVAATVKFHTHLPPQESLRHAMDRAREAVVSAAGRTSPPAVTQAGGADERAAFEAWFWKSGQPGCNLEEFWLAWQARAALAAQPTRVAMTDEAIRAALIKADVAPSDDYESVFEEGVKAAERHHGITPGDGGAKT